MAAARCIGLAETHLEDHGRLQARVCLDALSAGEARRRAKYVVVTGVDAESPVGTTTQAIGVAMALGRLGERAVCVTSQPWLGDVLERGASIGGGRATVLPGREAGLGLTADACAVGVAHDLLAAAADRSLGSPLAATTWRRLACAPGVGLASPVRSEVMSILGFADGLADLRRRLRAIVVGRDGSDADVTAADLGVAGAMAVLLREALRPTLLPTTEGTPVLAHGGPGAAGVPGGASIVAERVGLGGGGYVLSEAGHGDVGAAMTFNVRCRMSRHRPAAALVVCRAGGDADRLRRSIEGVRLHGIAAVVAISRFAGDSDSAVAATRAAALAAGADEALVGAAHADGGSGAEALARAVVAACEGAETFHFLYSEDDSLHDKLLAIGRHVHGVPALRLSEPVRGQIDALERRGHGRLPVCLQVASGAAASGGALTIDRLGVAAGAGYVVACSGPGAELRAAGSAHYRRLDLDADGRIIGWD